MDWSIFGSHRWMGPWGTPNLAGAALAQFLMIVPAVVVSVGWRKPMPMIVSAMLLMGVAWISLLLVATGSRGGWVAAAIGICWWGWRAATTDAERPAIARCGMAMVVGLGLGALLCMPAAQRMCDLVAPASDGSVQCRIVLWRSAAAMAFDHPWTGIGDFGSAFNRWYAPASMTNNTWPMAISDPMQVAADRGLVLFSILATCLATLVVVGMRAAGRTGTCLTTWCFAASGVLLVAITAGLFSNLAWRPWCLVPAMIAAVTLLGCACWRRDYRAMGPGVVAGVSVTMVIACVGWWQASGSVLVVSHGAVEAAMPRHGARGVIGIVGGENDDLVALVRGPGRSLVDAGWGVEVVSYRDRIALTNQYAGFVIYGGGAGVHIPEMEKGPVVLIDPHLGDGGCRGRTTLLVGRSDRLPVARPGEHLLVFTKARCWPKDFSLIAKPIASFFADPSGTND